MRRSIDICIYIHIYTYTYTYTFLCTHVYIYVETFISKHRCTHRHVHLSTHTFSRHTPKMLFQQLGRHRTVSNHYSTFIYMYTHVYCTCKYIYMSYVHTKQAGLRAWAAHDCFLNSAAYSCKYTDVDCYIDTDVDCSTGVYWCICTHRCRYRCKYRCRLLV